MRRSLDAIAKYALIRAIIYILFGALLLAMPQAVMKAIVYVLAGYLIVLGLLAIFSFARGRPVWLFGAGFAVGLVLIVFGILMIVFQRQLLSIVPILFGLLLVVGGAFVVALGINAGRFIGKSNWWLIILGALVVIGALVIVFNPFDSLMVLARIYGVIVIALGVAQAAIYFIYKDAID